MPETMRLKDVDIQLLHLVRRPKPEHRTETWRLAVDFWLDKRLEMTAPFRNYPVPVIPGR